MSGGASNSGWGSKNNWHKEGLVGHDQVRAIDSELPFEPEVSLGPIVSVFRDCGRKSAQLLICLRIDRSQASPPSSSLFSLLADCSVRFGAASLGASKVRNWPNSDRRSPLTFR
jgi:hypothetical protein